MITRGDSGYWEIEVVKTDNSAFPLLDVEITVTYKLDQSLPDADALFQHRIKTDASGNVVSASGMRIPPGKTFADGIVEERLSPEESVNFTINKYKYDVQIRHPSAWSPGVYDIWTPIRGEDDEVVADYTRTPSL